MSVVSKQTYITKIKENSSEVLFLEYKKICTSTQISDKKHNNLHQQLNCPNFLQ